MIEKIQFNKYENGLVPAIIQNAETGKVLMLGFMNREAVEKTLKEKQVTFYSRSKKRLWTKGETSGNTLLFSSMTLDCDEDTLLVQAIPKGSTCHKGTESCFEGDLFSSSFGFLKTLENTIQERKQNPKKNAYTTSLFEAGTDKIAQKVGEEAVELVIESKNKNDDLFLNESADLLFHFLVLLRNRGMSLADVEKVLLSRS